MVRTKLDIGYKSDEIFFYDSPRPKRNYEIKKFGRIEWEKFRKYHYLNTSITKSAQCFGLYNDGQIIGFIGVIHQPHGHNPKIKRVTRMVILPDYQGIGLGIRFLDVVANYYSDMGFDFSIKTSAKNLIFALKKHDKWLLNSYGYSNCSSTSNAIDYNRQSLRTKTKTASFMFIKRR